MLTITSKTTRSTGIPQAFLVTVKDRAVPEKMVYWGREKSKSKEFPEKIAKVNTVILD